MTDEFENLDLTDWDSSEESPSDPSESKFKLRPWIGAIALLLAFAAVLRQHEITQRIAVLEANSVPRSLFQPPADLNRFIETVRASTVVIQCNDSTGSGWVIDLGSPDPTADPEMIRIGKQFPTKVITNHHVIDECIDTPGKVRATANGNSYDAWLYS